MIVKTEDEAFEIRCCGPEGCGEVDPRATSINEGTPRYSIGKRCMAFRENVIERRTTEAAHASYSGDPEPGAFADGWRIKRSIAVYTDVPRLEWIRTDGFYCGRAGAPV